MSTKTIIPPIEASVYGLLWLEKTQNSYRVSKLYVDLAGDLTAGIVLGQIVYWWLPTKEGKSKLRVFKQGRYWLAKKLSDWFEELRITIKQARRALRILKEKGLIETKVWKFAGAPTTHISLNVEKLVEDIKKLYPELDIENEVENLETAGFALKDITITENKENNKKSVNTTHQKKQTEENIEIKKEDEPLLSKLMKHDIPLNVIVKVLHSTEEVKKNILKLTDSLYFKTKVLNPVAFILTAIKQGWNFDCLNNNIRGNKEDRSNKKRINYRELREERDPQIYIEMEKYYKAYLRNA